MNTLASRLKIALKESGAKKTDLWKACGITSGAVTQWFDGTTQQLEGKNLIAAAKVLKVNPNWLATGKGMQAPNGKPDVTQAPDVRGFVPLIGWVQAGDFTEAIDLLATGDGEMVPISVPKKRNTFALEVTNDSMSPDFPPGMRLIVEPDMDFQAGDYVIAKNGGDATFKQLVKDGGVWYLKPINSQYPTKPLGESRIIGVVREAVRKLR